jgi:hypothetical protein
MRKVGGSPSLLARLERLEARQQAQVPLMFRYGWLRPLPKDYTGTRHVVIVDSQPSANPNVEWCQFEERPGGAPAGDSGSVALLSR